MTFRADTYRRRLWNPVQLLWLLASHLRLLVKYGCHECLRWNTALHWFASWTRRTIRSNQVILVVTKCTPIIGHCFARPLVQSVVLQVRSSKPCLWPTRTPFKSFTVLVCALSCLKGEYTAKLQWLENLTFCKRFWVCKQTMSGNKNGCCLVLCAS